MKGTLLTLIAMVALGLAAPWGWCTESEGWRIAGRDHTWSFPRDHWTHPGYKVEWWYVTGHLLARDDPARTFGYQITFFRVGLLTEPSPGESAWAATDLVMGHAAITDVNGAAHHFSEVLYRANGQLGGFGAWPDSVIAWSAGPPGTDSRWSLSWIGDAFAMRMADDAQGMGLELTVRPTRPPLFQGPEGLSRKGREVSAASLYYSFTRLRAEGQIRVGEETLSVDGVSWMDREFGSNQLGADQVGWDWFSVQLDDGRDLMLYALRDASGAIDEALGTIRSGEEAPRYLERDDFTVDVRSEWTSPRTGATYPDHWRIRVAGLDLDVVPLVPHQENVARRAGGLAYWEGAVSIRDARGQSIGRGYVELTGYGGRTALLRQGM